MANFLDVLFDPNFQAPYSLDPQERGRFGSNYAAQVRSLPGRAARATKSVPESLVAGSLLGLRGAKTLGEDTLEQLVTPFPLSLSDRGEQLLGQVPQGLVDLLRAVVPRTEVGRQIAGRENAGGGIEATDRPLPLPLPPEVAARVQQQARGEAARRAAQSAAQSAAPSAPPVTADFLREAIRRQMEPNRRIIDEYPPDAFIREIRGSAGRVGGSDRTLAHYEVPLKYKEDVKDSQGNILHRKGEIMLDEEGRPIPGFLTNQFPLNYLHQPLQRSPTPDPELLALLQQGESTIDPEEAKQIKRQDQLQSLIETLTNIGMPIERINPIIVELLRELGIRRR